MLLLAAFLTFGCMAVKAQSNISINPVGQLGADRYLKIQFSEMSLDLVDELEDLHQKEELMFDSFVVKPREKTVEVIIRFEDMGTREVIDFFQSHVDVWTFDEDANLDVTNEESEETLAPEPSFNAVR